MNLDEETFLSAYLDGELSPDQKDRVGSALVADPALADHLLELTVVRDLVSGLSRPGLQVDLASRVMVRLERRPTSVRLLGQVVNANSWGARVAALTAAAATLLISTSIVVQRQVRQAGDAAAPALVTNKPAGATRTIAEPLPTDPPSVAPAVSPAVAVVRESSPATGEAARVQEESRKIHALLENPDLHKVFVVSDVIGGQAGRRVGEMVDATPRRNATYGRIVVNQGIVIDPSHAGEAVVFALVMNEMELADFQKKLTHAFPDAIEEAEPRGEMAAKLAQVGRISFSPGIAVADLKPQPTLLVEESGVALMENPEDKRGQVRSRVSVEVSPGVDPMADANNRGFGPNSELIVLPRNEPTPEQNNSAPASATARASKDARTMGDEPRAREEFVGPPAPAVVSNEVKARPPDRLVLVWVGVSRAGAEN